MNSNKPSVKIVFLPKWMADFISATKERCGEKYGHLTPLNVLEILSEEDKEKLRSANWYFKKFISTGLSKDIVLSNEITTNESVSLDFMFSYIDCAVANKVNETVASVDPMSEEELPGIVLKHYSNSKVSTVDDTIVVYGNSMVEYDRTKKDVIEDILVNLATLGGNGIEVNRNPLFLDYLLCS